MLIIPLNLDYVLLFLHNSKLAYWQGVFKRTEIVLISVHLEAGRQLTVVQRFKVSFIREMWLPVRETGRFELYPGNFRIIGESWHVCV